MLPQCLAMCAIQLVLLAAACSSQQHSSVGSSELLLADEECKDGSSGVAADCLKLRRRKEKRGGKTIKFMYIISIFLCYSLKEFMKLVGRNQRRCILRTTI